MLNEGRISLLSTTRPAGCGDSGRGICLGEIDLERIGWFPSTDIVLIFSGPGTGVRRSLRSEFCRLKVPGRGNPGTTWRAAFKSKPCFSEVSFSCLT